MKYDILSINSETITYSCEVNKINSIKKNSSEKHGFRRFENGKVFQTSKVGKTNLDQLLTESKKWGGSGLDFNCPLAAENIFSKKDTTDYKDHLENFKSALEILHLNFPQFIFKGNCEVSHIERTLKSDYGLDLCSLGSEINWYIIYQRMGSGGMFDGFISGAGACTDILKSATDHFEILKKYDHLVQIKNGLYPVILGDEESSLAPLAKLNESFLANKYHDGSSLFSHKLGSKLFHSKVNILDQAFSFKNNNLKFFDGEGTSRFQDLALIENGEFKNLIYDLRYANQYKAQSTGNGLRLYNQGVNLGFRNLYFKPGLQNIKSIMNELDQCIYVNIASGGDSNALGEYSTPIQTAYLYEKGELVGRLPQLTVKTSIQKALNEDFVAISSDGFNPGSPGGNLISNMEVYNN